MISANHSSTQKRSLLHYESTADKEEYLRGLFRSVYLAGIVERKRVAHVAKLDDLVDVLSSGVGSLTNPSRLRNTFRTVKGKRIDDKTIASYIGYLEDAYLVSEAQRYDVKGRKYMWSPKKYYFEDVGMRNARIGFRQVEENHLMENVIYNELLLRGYKADVGVLDKLRDAGYARASLSNAHSSKRCRQRKAVKHSQRPPTP